MAEKLEDLLFGLEEKFWLKGAEHYAGNLPPAAVMVSPILPAVEDFKREVHGGRDYGPEEMQPPAEPGLSRSRTIR
jgi:hypothetical protein